MSDSNGAHLTRKGSSSAAAAQVATAAASGRVPRAAVWLVFAGLFLEVLLDWISEIATKFVDLPACY